MLYYFISAARPVFLLTVVIASGAAAAPPGPEGPDPEGLVAWLDASADPTLERDSEGRVTAWRSRGPAHLAAIVNPEAAPAFVADAFGPGRPAVRFDGDAALQLPALGDGDGPLMAFVVFRRGAGHTGNRWQRLLSIGGGDPSERGGETLHLDPPDGRQPTAARIEQATWVNTPRGPAIIGRHAGNGGDRLTGDIAEVLIYDRAFVADPPYERVRAYLAKKWNVVEDPREDWTRRRPLGELPVRTTDNLPGWDQANEGGWTPLPAFSDGFDGDALDALKWFDHNPHWYGRPPSLFLPRNVAVADGTLQLTMRHEPRLPPVEQYNGDSKYHTFSSASIVSREYVTYGAFEIEARAMPSAGSSAWWFFAHLLDAEGRATWTEIDMFELGALSPKYGGSYNINAHVFTTLEDGPKKSNSGGHWPSDFAFHEDFHVYGVQWTPDEILYFVDGVRVRRMPNTGWHHPLQMVFDSETMGDWLGMPDPSELPATFHVRWVRAWAHADTVVGLNDADGQPKWFLQDGHPTEVTRFLETYPGAVAPATKD